VPRSKASPLVLLLLLVVVVVMVLVAAPWPHRMHQL